MVTCDFWSTFHVVFSPHPHLTLPFRFLGDLEVSLESKTNKSVQKEGKGNILPYYYQENWMAMTGNQQESSLIRRLDLCFPSWRLITRPWAIWKPLPCKPLHQSWRTFGLQGWSLGLRISLSILSLFLISLLVAIWRRPYTEPLLSGMGQFAAAILLWPTRHGHFAAANLPRDNSSWTILLNAINVICHCFFDIISTFVNGDNVKETVAANIYCCELSRMELSIARWLWWVGCGELS